jgi:hypothetical protein
VGRYAQQRGRVEDSEDLQRILALPRRQPQDLPQLVAEMSAWLRQPTADPAKHVLREAQALALYELAAFGELFAPIKCGGGKTLVSLLAAQVLPFRRPLLLLPSALIERTQRDAARLSEHWRIWLPRLMGYQSLSRKAQAAALEAYSPDCIISDESHFLANLEHAGVARRVGRYLAVHPDCVYVDMSGTAIGKDFRKYQHRLAWSHGTDSPLPIVRAEVERWQAAVYPAQGAQGCSPGALVDAFPPDPAAPDQSLSASIVQWIRDTPGVVGTDDVGCGASLEYSLWRPELPKTLQAAIDKVRSTECRPDGVDLLDDFAGVSQTVNQMALGFWYRWEPAAPPAWLAARKAWWRFVRDVLGDHEEAPHCAKCGRVGAACCGAGTVNVPLDTELQVRLAYPRVAAEWMALRPSFVPNSVPVWETSAVIEQMAAWARGEVMAEFDTEIGNRKNTKTAKSSGLEDADQDTLTRAVHGLPPDKQRALRLALDKSWTSPGQETGQAQDKRLNKPRTASLPGVTGSIIWTRYRAVGLALEVLGVPYFGQNAKTATGPRAGLHVELAKPADGPICASIRSCGTGQNLQPWNRNLVTTLVNYEMAEQLISRTHRPGQEADTVYVDWIRAVPEHTDTLRQCRQDADLMTEQGDPQRLSIGTWVKE